MPNGIDRSPSSWWRLVAYIMLGLIPLLQIGILIAVLWPQIADIPIRDEWALVTLLQERDRGQLGLDDFFAFHNEHRIVFSRLIGLAVVDFTGWNRHVYTLVDLAIVGVTFIMLFIATRKTIGTALGTAVLAVPLSLLLFSHSRWENWFVPITDKIPTALGVALCCWAFATRPIGRWWFGPALAGAVIASLSSMGGLVVWPAFLPAAIWAGRRFAISWGAIAVTVIGLYLIDFPRGGTNIALDFVQMPAFVFAYLGAPVGGNDLIRAQFATVASLLLVSLNVIACWRLRAFRENDVALVVPWLGLGLFAVGTGLLGSMSRAPDWGPAAGLYSRYHAFALFWWVACLVVLYLSTVRIVDFWPKSTTGRQVFAARTMAVVNGVAAILLLVSTVGTNVEGSKLALRTSARYLEAQPCFLLYQHANEQCLDVFYAGAVWIPRAPDYLSNHGLALFHDETSVDPTQLPVHPAGDTGAVMRIGDNRVGGNRAQPIVVEAGSPLTLVGWGFDPTLGQPASGVLVTIDDREPFWDVANRQRPAIAEQFGSPTFLYTGYNIELPAEALTPGDHTITVQVVAADLQSIYEPNPKSEVIRIQILSGNPD